MNLIVQGPSIETADATRVAELAGASARRQVGESAWRLSRASESNEVLAYCESRSLDCAWVPEGRRFADLGLIAMDMDSTLITIECIDEIGGMLGIKAEIAAITERAMRGEIDYAESLKQRVALLKGLGVEALDRVYREKLELSPGAERLVKHATALGVRTLLVSGGFTFFTERLKQRLNLDYTLSNVLETQDGRLTGRVAGAIVDAAAKAAQLVELTSALGLRKDQTVAIGDGANDVPMMAEAGVSVAYHAKAVVRAKATYALNHSGLGGVIHLFE